MASGDSFIGLRQFVKGKIDKYQLMDIDKSIEGVQGNGNNIGQTLLRINLGENGVFKMLGLSDDDIWFYTHVSGPYGNYEAETKDSVEQSFFEGYCALWDYLDSDNIETLEQIAKYVYPKEFDLNDEKFTSEFAVRLNSMFEHEVDDIIRDYVWEKNREINIVAARHMDEDLEDSLERNGLIYISPESIKISLNELMNLYIQKNLTHLNIKKLLNTAISEDSNIGGWFDNVFDYQDDDEFDKDGFNRSVKRNLDKILDEIQDETKDWQQYTSLVDEIRKKFHIDHWYPIPKTDNYLFLIDGFDKEKRRVIVKIRNVENTKRNTLKLSLDNFYKMLYQPELFKFEDLYNL